MKTGKPLPEPDATKLIFKLRLKNRISTLLTEIMPGFMPLFSSFWEHKAPPVVLQLAHSPQQLLDLNRRTLLQKLSPSKVQKPGDVTDKLLIWAKSSIGTSDDFPAKVYQLKVEWQRLLNSKETIRTYNVQIAQYLAQNPALLFLSVPWINVPSASEYASELGPFDNFTSPKQIIAYLGLAPKKFQTGKVSFENGHITRKGKSHGRASVMNISNNLVQGNDYYTPNYLNLLSRGKAKQHAKVAIANKFVRNSFRMIENGQVFSPPTWTGKILADKPIEKLKDFLHNNTNDKEIIEKIVTQAEQTLAIVLKEKTPSQQKETELQPKQQVPQTPKVIYQRPKLESVGTKVAFTRISPPDYKEPVHIREVLDNMVALRKLQPWVLTGKGPEHAQLS